VVALGNNRAPLPTCAFTPPSPIAVGVGQSTSITVTASGVSGNATGLMLASEPFYGAGAVSYDGGSGMGGSAGYQLVLRPGDLDGRGYLSFLVGDKNGLSACSAAIDPVP
jgi:hypothetical protein